MSARQEKSITKSGGKRAPEKTISREVLSSYSFDPKQTAQRDAKEIVGKYAKEIKAAINA